jgi:hypothetical protein
LGGPIEVQMPTLEAGIRKKITRIFQVLSFVRVIQISWWTCQISVGVLIDEEVDE